MSRPTAADPTVTSPLAIVGSGVIGALSALTAAQLGLKVLWFGPAEADRLDGADARNYALSPATVGLLKRLGVWPALEANSCTVTRMEVFSGASRVDLTASDSGVEFLSAMVTHRNLLDVLEQALKFRAPVTRVPVRPNNLEALPDRVRLGVDGKTFDAQLVLGADGARSWVRGQAGILWGQRDYGQNAIVAAFHTEFPHGGVAAQWFDRGDILALLPLADPQQVSMVWSSSRVDLLDPDLNAIIVDQIADRTAMRFGRLRLVGGLTSSPLRMLLTDELTAPRIALLGDAAHTVHPLAGYGLNLGIQDLLCLENIWKEYRSDPGNGSALAAYRRQRLRRIKTVQWSLDLLQRWVVQPHPTLQRLSQLSMRVVANTGLLRQLLIRQAIGPS
jgi:ubiquinone biosynthesis UbiH/UbiF/VisC/COQ6 family hydroxylase